MASKSGGSARTAPKGRATASRNARTGRRSFLSARMEWLLAIVVILIVLAVVVWIGRDWRSSGGGGGFSGAPADVVTIGTGDAVDPVPLLAG